MKLKQLKLSNYQTISTRKSVSGISAIEFLIGVAAVGVILLLTVPSVSTMIQSHYLNSTVSDLASSLKLAKNEAERRHSTVRLCPSSDGITCQQIGDWNNGWLLFSDGNEDGKPQEIELIQVHEPVGDMIRILASGALSDSPAFTLAGLTSKHNLKSGEFTVCSRDSDASPRSKIVVSLDGDISLVKNDKNNCR